MKAQKLFKYLEDNTFSRVEVSQSQAWPILATTDRFRSPTLPMLATLDSQRHYIVSAASFNLPPRIHTPRSSRCS
jgi:hypothetical protein